MTRRRITMMFLGKSIISRNVKKAVKLATLSCLSAIIVTGCEVLPHLQRGKVIDRWEATNGSLRVRILQYDEKGSYPAPGGAYYVFQSAVNTSDSWNEIMTFRHDDPVAIPRDHVRFINERVGYVFMGWLYAVTTDGGRSWSVWDASKDPALSKTYNYDLIREVSISPDGTGRMVLKLIGDAKTELKTKNYGRQWTAE
jgi:hypothetical protein